jgi:small-conductance mechanosensitive channel
MRRRLALLLGLALATAAAAQEVSSLPPTITTTGDPTAFETEASAMRGELRARLDAVQATASESRTAQIVGLPDALAAQVTSLEDVLTRLAQQIAARRAIHATQLTIRRLEEDLTQLRANGPAEPPPYPIDELDTLEAEARAETSRRPSLEASASTSAKAREEAIGQLTKARARLTAAQAAQDANQDATRTPTLQALTEAAQAELQRTEELFRFRDLDHQGDRLDLEANQLRSTLLDERTQWIRRDLVFRDEDLERLHLALDKTIFDRRRTLDVTRLEASAAERRWTSLRSRVDAKGDATELEELEVQTRFQELQAAQREAVLLEARLQRAQTAKELWEARHQLRTLGEDLEALRALRQPVDAALESLGREQHLQESRLSDLRRERATIEAKVGPEAGARARLLRGQVAALDRFLEAGRANLASIEAASALAQRTRDELQARYAELTRYTPWRQATSLAAQAWEDYLQPFAWPLGKLLLILFLGIPLNVMLARRVREGVSRVYSAQTGMLVSKLVYYTGAVILLGFFLNVLGVGLGALVGAAGVTGVALGFASQTSVSNIISGLFLIAEQPFQVGEMVTVGDVTGVVLSIDLISVKLRKFDNELVRIPNETILKSNLTNISRHPIRRIPLDVSVAYKEDLRDNPDVLENPEPGVLFQGFGTSGIDVRLNAWTVQPNFLAVKSALFKDVKRRLDEAGIHIPFPAMSLYPGASGAPIEVHLRGEEVSATEPSSPQGSHDESAGGPTVGDPPPRSEGGPTS